MVQLSAIDHRLKWDDLARRIEEENNPVGKDPAELLNDLTAAFGMKRHLLRTCYSSLEYAMRLCHQVLPNRRESISNMSPDMAAENYFFLAEISPPANGGRRVEGHARTPSRALMAAICRGIAHDGIQPSAADKVAREGHPFGPA